MATERTPPHKRIKRAEEGRDTWKIKAIERREESQRLKLELERKEESLTTKEDEIKELKKAIAASIKTINKQQEELENLKKKL
jgi:archaellum component FlaC